MDPNATLKRIRQIIAEGDDGSESLTEELPELVEALDEWLSKGGFLPLEWAKGRNKEGVRAAVGSIEAELSHNRQRAEYPTGTPYDNPVED